MPPSATHPGESESPHWFPDPSTFVLHNGLRVIAVSRDRSPVVEARLVTGSGFAADPPEREGLAGMAMAMVTEGALQIDGEPLDTIADSLGAVFDGRAGADGATIAMSALSGNLEAALACFSSLIQGANFSDRAVDAIRVSRHALIEHERQAALGLAMRLLPPILYGAEHPYARPLSGSGTTGGVTAVTADDLRRYFAQLSPERSTLVIAGPLEAARMITVLENTLGNWLASGRALKAADQAPPVARIQSPVVTIVDRPDTRQASIVVGLQSPARGAIEAHAQIAAEAILAGLFTSRLNLNLREGKGWTYGVRSTLLAGRLCGLWLLTTAIRRDRAALAMDEIAREIDNLAFREPCSADELGHAVDSLVARMPSSYETCGQISDALADTVMYQLPTDYHQVLAARLRGLRPSDISEFFRQILSRGGPRWLLVGDASELFAQLDGGDWGKIDIIDGGRNLP
ncbi:MAG TPA: pitrilysin family protein [Candidatus Binataceae bacterium]|nr:pitrilysin family protein [Candidatus Binataceae bacterium]